MNPVRLPTRICPIFTYRIKLKKINKINFYLTLLATEFKDKDLQNHNQDHGKECYLVIK